MGILVACIGDPDPGDMKLYAPVGEETFDDAATTEECAPTTATLDRSDSLAG